MTESARTQATFCRICEPACPISASLDGEGRLTGLAPDFDHPSRGVACHKGLSYGEINSDPDRLNWPLKRMNPKTEARGEFARVSWDEALAEIGERVGALRRDQGKNSIGVYLGNPPAFNAAGLMMAGQFQDLLDTSMRFSANTQDAANKFAAIGAVYGSGEAVMIPDLTNTHYLLCIGANPKVSRWTLLSQPNDWDVVKRIRRRGGKVVFVNPRRTESSTVETGPTILIRPGSDVYFLAAVLHEIDLAGGFDAGLTGRYARNLDGLRAFASNYPAERVASITGVSAEDIRQVAHDFMTAKSAVVCASTGVNQSRQGVLCIWLVEMLNFVTGNLGRVGGAYKPAGLFDHFAPAGSRQIVKTSLGEFSLPDPIGYSVLPGALLSDLLASGEIRALFAIGGNPLLSVGGGKKAREAYAKLDCLVTLDIFRSATAEMSDFILPSADWLERPDINLIALGHQPIPYVQYSDPVLPAAAERRNDWWILAKIAEALGLETPLTEDPMDMTGRRSIEGLLAAGGLTIDDVRAEPSQTKLLPTLPHDSLFHRCLKYPDGKIDCMPQSFIDQGLVKRCADIFDEDKPGREGALSLISLRTPFLHNSWFNNSQKFRKGKNRENPLHMTQGDADRKRLVAGDRVRVWNDYGEVFAQLLIDDDLCPGVVAMSHGYGQEHSYGLRTARRNPGANCNNLMPVGADQFEPLSYMSWMSGVPVAVERADH